MLSGFLVTLLLLVPPRIIVGTSSAENATTTATTTEVTVKDDVTQQIRIEASRVQPQRRQLQLINDTSLVNRTESSGGFVPTVPSFQLGPVVDAAGPLIDIPRLNETTEPPAPRPNRTRLRSPFNSLGTIQFENGQLEQKNDKKLPPEPAFRPSQQDSTFVKFVDDDDDESNRQYTEEEIGSKNAALPGTPVIQGYIQPIYHQSFTEQTTSSYLPTEDTGYQQYVAYETKPAKFHHDPVVHHHHHTLLPNEASTYQSNHLAQPAGPDDKPEMVINVHPISYQSQSYDMLTKPKTVIYVTTHDEAPNVRKFPYPPPPSGLYEHQEIAATRPEEHYQYPLLYESPHPKSISPWKKILHVIGAFLPLGLLFALLSPKVITPYDQPGTGTGAGGGTNDPGIVLSKLRVDDLPAEHKSAAVCEERTVCRLLVAAENSPAGSTLLRELLKQFTNRTAESAVRKKELDRIFEAAKLGNCDILTCNFYDGT